MKEVGEILLQKIRTREILDKIPNGCVLLDVGCGDDFFLLKLVKGRIKRGYGLDERVQNTNVENLSLRNYVINNKLPFKNNFFDVITALAVFEHLGNPKKIVSEFHRILKPNGKIIMTIPSKGADKLYKYFLLPLRLVNVESVSEHKYYSYEQLYDFFSKSGFKNIKIKGFELGFNIFLEAKK